MALYENYADKYCTGEWDVNTLKNTVEGLIRNDKDDEYWLHPDQRQELNREIRKYRISCFDSVEDVIETFMNCEYPEAKGLNIDDILYAACLTYARNDETVFPLNRENPKQVTAFKYDILFVTDHFRQALRYVSNEKKKCRDALANSFKKARGANSKYLEVSDLENIISGSSDKFNVFYAPDAVKYGSLQYVKLEDDYLNFVVDSALDMPYFKRVYSPEEREALHGGIKEAAITNRMSVSSYVDRINPDNKFNKRCEDTLVLDLFDNILKHA